MDSFALYRKLNGVSVFTGFVDRNGTICRLHDVSGDIDDGDAHEATPQEFLLQMALYDGSEENRVQKEIPVVSVADKDEAILEGKVFGDGVEFFPFATSHTSGVLAKFRADDRVMVVVYGERVCKHGSPVPTRESFWCHVVSVSPQGKVTAVPTVQLKWSPIGPHEPVLFDAACVLAMKHGQYWHKDETPAAPRGEKQIAAQRHIDNCVICGGGDDEARRTGPPLRRGRCRATGSARRASRRDDARPMQAGHGASELGRWSACREGTRWLRGHRARRWLRATLT
eukprot:5227479-Prymnesium_polylepis.1